VTTSTAPVSALSDVNADDVVHLVCGCQLDGRVPRVPILTAMCGMTEAPRAYVPNAQKWCSMCVEEAETGLCPACGKAGH
jgi:hypothetical protein